MAGYGAESTPGHPCDDTCERLWWPDSDQRSIAVRRNLGLDFSLLRHLKSIVDLDAKVSYCALKLGMA